MNTTTCFDLCTSFFHEPQEKLSDDIKLGLTACCAGGIMLTIGSQKANYVFQNLIKRCFASHAEVDFQPKKIHDIELILLSADAILEMTTGVLAIAYGFLGMTFNWNSELESKCSNFCKNP